MALNSESWSRESRSERVLQGSCRAEVTHISVCHLEPTRVFLMTGVSQDSLTSTEPLSACLGPSFPRGGFNLFKEACGLLGGSSCGSSRTTEGGFRVGSDTGGAQLPRCTRKRKCLAHGSLNSFIFANSAIWWALELNVVSLTETPSGSNAPKNGADGRDENPV